MADEFLRSAAQQRANELMARRKQAEVHLTRAEAEHDIDTASAMIQEIADIDAAGNRLDFLIHKHEAAMNQPADEPLSEQEFLSIKPERLKNNPALRNQVLDQIMSKSKY